MLKIKSNINTIAICTCIIMAPVMCFGAKPVVKRPVIKPKPRPVIRKRVETRIEPKQVDVKSVKLNPVEVPGQLVISPSAETGSQLYNTWPLIISVSLWRKAPVADDKGNLPAVEPIAIKAKEGAWRDALIVEAVNSSGTAVKWPLHPVKQSDASITLGVNDTATAEWWLEPSETQTLAEGTYTIKASFDAKLIDGLPKDISSDVFHLKIIKEPSTLDTDTESEKQLQLALLSSLKDDQKTANELVDKLLAADGENIGGHRLKAKLLVREGKKLEAISSMDKALNSYFKKYPNACPPVGLFNERAEILNSITLQTADDSGSRSSE